MKLKQHPEDFQVEELTDAVPSAEGVHAFYRLTKTGWTTPDALQVIRHRWKLTPRRISSGGLKDRHAKTIQYLTIFHGPKRRLTHQGISLEYLGQLAEPYTSKDIRGNRFHLTLRSLSEDDVDWARKSLDEIRREGVPNYFDDQRFGSVSEGADGIVFVAKLMVLGRHEEALRQALAAPYEHDRGPAKKEKAILLAHWGDWKTLKEKLPRGHACSLIEYLDTHSDDFLGALARLHPELRGLYLSAYQSFLWNRMLARWLERSCRPEQVVPVQLRLGAMPMHRGLDDARLSELTALSLPLPTARLHLDPGDPRLSLVQEILSEEGLELKQLQVKGIRELFFSKGDRAGLCIPGGLDHESGQDESNKGRQKLVLSFELPRGAYATMIVKRISRLDSV